ncbi:unnamed protein product [Gongylonema pulchrum]|uniref:Uncharacterized protein n=1 Tax=Gongylonema pulchrum TaxID=637853 RepID=A0A183DJP9_9BILA|nr:unnamed protein product [Gongylonema pulchrum]
MEVAGSANTTSDCETYAADYSNLQTLEQSTPSTPTENSRFPESTGGLQSRLQYMHPFSGIYTPPVLPLLSPFVPLRKFLQSYC